jgi:hypothetical protein
MSLMIGPARFTGAAGVTDQSDQSDLTREEAA